MKQEELEEAIEAGTAETETPAEETDPNVAPEAAAEVLKKMRDRVV